MMALMLMLACMPSCTVLLLLRRRWRHPLPPLS